MKYKFLMKTGSLATRDSLRITVERNDSTRGHSGIHAPVEEGNRLCSGAGSVRGECAVAGP